MTARARVRERAVVQPSFCGNASGLAGSLRVQRRHVVDLNPDQDDQAITAAVVAKSRLYAAGQSPLQASIAPKNLECTAISQSVRRTAQTLRTLTRPVVWKKGAAVVCSSVRCTPHGLGLYGESWPRSASPRVMAATL